MVKGISIGMMVIIGLVVWWLIQRQEVQAIALAPKTYIRESENEQLYVPLPITASTERLLEVYGEG